MYLKTLKLKNFRSYDSIEVEFDKNLNVIIGKNDIGKSTLLEALDIFFGQERIKIDITDKNVFQGSEMSISCCFITDDDKEYLIDTDVKTKLKDEYLLNKDGLLEIKKVWDCSKDKLTASSLKTYIVCEYPKELGRVNQVDPLGITNLRIRGMWQIENPRKVFSYLHEPTDKEFELVCIIPIEKYNSFPNESRTKLEGITKTGFSVENKQIKDPNNPAKLMDCKLIKLCV